LPGITNLRVDPADLCSFGLDSGVPLAALASQLVFFLGTDPWMDDPIGK
jgi:hypothetical protein